MLLSHYLSIYTRKLLPCLISGHVQLTLYAYAADKVDLPEAPHLTRRLFLERFEIVLMIFWSFLLAFMLCFEMFVPYFTQKWYSGLKEFVFTDNKSWFLAKKNSDSIQTDANIFCELYLTISRKRCRTFLFKNEIKKSD